jgi:two-component system nitrogen regulation sensor histidine kinase NtrY
MERKKKILSLFLLLLFFIILIIWIAVSETINISPIIFGDTIILFSLIIVVLLLFLITFFVLARNIAKLILEKKQNIIGSQFKIKLVLFFVGFSIVPAILLFFFASGIISKNIEQWYKGPIESMMNNAEKLKTSIFLEYKKSTLHFSERLLNDIVKKNIYMEKDRQLLSNFLIKKLKEYNLDLVSCYENNREIVTILNPGLPLYEYRNIPDELVLKGVINGEIFRTDKLGSGEILRGGKSKSVKGINILIITGKFLNEEQFSPLRKMVFSLRKYNQLKKLKDPIKTTYILIFLFVTLLIIFSASWLGIHLAKDITVPIEKLTNATNKISAGIFDTRIEYMADDEFYSLIKSFNKMVEDIGKMREKEENQRIELQKGKEFQESILQNIRAGIIVIDEKNNILEINSTASDFLKIDYSKNIIGQSLGSLLKERSLENIYNAIVNIKKMGLKTNETQLQIEIEGEKREIALKITHLRKGSEGSGELIIVIDDLTELIRVKRLSDWKMIAEKVAHEIKNPLTPIKLSAQRIIKNIEKGEDKFKQIAKESSISILSEISGLKNLLENFLSFARLPTPKLKEGNINYIIEETVNIFREIHKNIDIEIELDPGIPELLLDHQQIKRVIINLLNNAAEAMEDKGQIFIKTYTTNKKIYIEFIDTGPGIKEELQQKIFNPYFSTKEKGSGLGLSIIYQIIQEHRGIIYLDKTYKKGAKFIMEFEK